jgi:hypothetical protein
MFLILHSPVFYENFLLPKEVVIHLNFIRSNKYCQQKVNILLDIDENCRVVTRSDQNQISHLPPFLVCIIR